MSSTNLIDARGPRFAATVTAVVLALALLTQSAWLLLAQTAVFIVGAKFGPSKSPYGLVYRLLVKPRLPSPTKFEDARPPQFAQLVGTFCASIGLLGAVIGVPLVFLVAVGTAVAAAFLNSAFGFCLGCEMYLLIKRIKQQASPTRSFVTK